MQEGINPFRYVPHPLVVEAAREVIGRIENDPGLDSLFRGGKMLGVLICSTPDTLLRSRNSHIINLRKDNSCCYLAAFSGSINGNYMIDGFVPPVYDLGDPEGYFKQEEARISAINLQIKALETSPEYISLKAEVTEAKRLMEIRLAEAREAMASARKEREAIRTGCEDYSVIARLITESQHQKAEFKRLKDSLKTSVRDLEHRLEIADAEINALKTQREFKSDALQKWIFRQFRMRNFLGEEADLIEIFAQSGLVPPGGTGECAAPKLLQYAALNGLQPIAMGEFWYGAAPSGSLRLHGHFYPSCSAKCGPLLPWLLRGLPSGPRTRGGLSNFSDEIADSFDSTSAGSFGSDVPQRVEESKSVGPRTRGGLSNFSDEIADSFDSTSTGSFGSDVPQRVEESKSVGPRTRGGPSSRQAKMVALFDPLPSGDIPGDTPGDTPYKILHSDNDLIAVSKPSGMLSVPGLDGSISLLELLQTHLSTTLHPVHRLDMDTSGIILFAKNSDSALSLRSQFEAHTIRKTYRARLCPPTPTLTADPHSQPHNTLSQLPVSGRISLPLAPDYEDRPRQKVDIKLGKESITDYRILSDNPDGTTDILFSPLTGRTHQLRIHSAHHLGLGRPILGDLLYGGHSALPVAASCSGAAPAPTWPADSPHLHLHAESITFIHPSTGLETTLVSR